MSDPFCRLFLDQVELIIKRELNSGSLLALLQLATPGLEGLGSADDSQKTFKTLLARVYPDKHPQDSTRATRLCQDAQAFYDSCMASSSSSSSLSSSSPPKTKLNRNTSPRSVSYPLEFVVLNKWTHIEYHAPHTKPDMGEEQMSCAVAYQCVNARGAIAHGRKTENKFNNESVLKESVWSKSVEDVFSLLGGA